jgi:hypothetical protein
MDNAKKVIIVAKNAIKSEEASAIIRPFTSAQK